jgi:hypothetical protein
VGFDGLDDLSLSPVTFISSVLKHRRSNCREGVTEIGNVLNGGQFTARFIAVTSTVLAKSILFLQSKQGNFNNAA